MAVRVHVQDLTRDEAYWDGVRNEALLGARELKAIEREKAQVQSHLGNAQSLLSKYAVENIELQNRVEELRDRVFDIALGAAVTVMLLSVLFVLWR